MKKILYAIVAFAAVMIVGFLNDRTTTSPLPVEQVHADNPNANMATDSSGGGGI